MTDLSDSAKLLYKAKHKIRSFAAAFSVSYQQNHHTPRKF